MFGIAILAIIFAHPGNYTSAHTFIEHFKNAVWIGAAFSAIGLIAAAAHPGRKPVAARLPLTTRATNFAVDSESVA